MRPSHRGIMEARAAVMDAIDERNSPFTAEDISTVAYQNLLTVNFLLRKLDSHGYITCLCRDPVVYTKTPRWVPRPYDIYGSTPKVVTWFDCLGFLPKTWQPVGL